MSKISEDMHLPSHLNKVIPCCEEWGKNNPFQPIEDFLLW